MILFSPVLVYNAKDIMQDADCKPFPPPTKRPNYFIRHWRGDLSLGVSYWVNGMLGRLLVLLADNTVEQMPNNMPITLLAILTIMIYAMFTLTSVWQLVGVWRSASKHVSRGGNGGWATAAQIAVVFGSVNCIGIVYNTYIPQSAEMVRILAGDKVFPAYTIRRLPGGTEIEYRGGLRAGSAKELERILMAVPQAKVLHIESGGGRLIEAKAMIKLIQDRGMTTYTADYCMSAATLVLMSGKERVIGTGAKIGFHAGTIPGITDDQIREMNDTVRTTMQSAGVSGSFIDRVLSTPADQMWYPTYEEMRAAGVITSQSPGDRFASSLGMLPDTDLEAAIDTMGSLPCFRTIKKVEPETYAKMLTNFVAALRAGKSGRRGAGNGGDAIGALIIKYVPSASDKALLGFRDSYIEMFTKYKDINSAACIACVTQQKINYKRAFPDWNMTNSLLMVEAIISSGSAGRAIPIDKTAADEDMATVLRPVRDKYGNDVKLLDDQKMWPDNSKKSLRHAINDVAAGSSVTRQAQRQLNTKSHHE